MTKVLALAQPEHVPTHFSSEQLDILKNTICKGVTQDEFKIFLMACQKTQLDPFMRQIYAVKRKAKKADGSWGETMTIQTGIDGYRLIAERTGCYAPGPEPTYIYNEKGDLVSATAYIKKQTKDGTWHTVSASAYFDEYCQTFQDRQTGDKKPSGMWVTLPRTMLSKCAEAQALRKAFPSEMSGVYTKEEMQQSDPIDVTPKISLEQANELELTLSECDPKYKSWVLTYLKNTYQIDGIVNITVDIYKKVYDSAIQNMHDYFKRQSESKELEQEAVTK